MPFRRSTRSTYARARARLRVGAAVALLVDHGGEQRRIEPVVPGVAAHHLLVLERIPEPGPPAGFCALQVDERAGDEGERRDDDRQPPDRVSSFTTCATNRSSSCSEPSFTNT